MVLVAGLLGPATPAAGAPSAVAARASSGCTWAPFRATPARGVWYRIPSVVRTPTGALVAFAERRDRIGDDLGDFDIVRARSRDGGCTWSQPVVIGDDAGNRVSNPVPLVDAGTGRILLFSVITARPGAGGVGKGLHLQTSTDDGVTFSALLAGPIRPGGQYKGGLTGPGHGIQLRVSHPGRLIFAMGYRTAAGRYGGYGIHSDDGGRTWQTGFDQQAPEGVRLIEGALAELPDGRVFVSYRNAAEGAAVSRTRLHAWSADGGRSLQSPFAWSPLPMTSVFGSVLAPTGSHAGQLLLSAPFGRESNRNLRRQMAIHVSRSGGASWGTVYHVDLEDRPGAYSDLVQLGDTTLGILYETGIEHAHERIAFRVVELSQLENPRLAGVRLTYRRATGPIAVSRPVRVQVLVAVAGAGSPPGRVTVTASRREGRRSAAVDLVPTNRGMRVLTLPRLTPGSWALTVSYSGTGRIAPARRSAGVVRVVTH